MSSRENGVSVNMVAARNIHCSHVNLKECSRSMDARYRRGACGEHSAPKGSKYLYSTYIDPKVGIYELL